LNLPPGFGAFGERVEHLPPAPYASYLRLLADSDISIAPLEPTAFNDAKSNIKFLEAAILGVPSVCSPRAHFAAVVRHDENGMLAEGDAAWFSCLSALASDGALRQRLGHAALSAVLEHYEPAAIARAQVAPLLRRAPDRRREGRLRVLFANVFYAPRSFGGATVVVEEMARRLHARGDTEVTIFTSLARDETDRALTRTDQNGIPVFAVPVADGDAIAEFDDPSVGIAFGQVLDAVRPHVVHLHAVQSLSASMTAACTARGIPYVITLHDAWWLCARQFMVRADGTYCFQEKIDLRVCQACLPGARYLAHRQVLLKAMLDGAALLLSPSEAHRRLYLANGVAPAQIEVAPNGVRLPPSRPVRAAAETLRFAYVGGSGDLKGFSIIKRAFEALRRGDWRLVLVDNTLALGFSSVSAAGWRVRGKLSVVPAYTQDGMDDFFAGIDVLLFPSQWKESFGLTVREALARDVWVIATDGGGPAEAIDDGVNGTLIPMDGRHESLLAAVETVLNDRARLAAYRNPRAEAIMDYAMQAETLRAILARVAAGATVSGTP
jgi:glycosyltransferase involved in cell wall biosynthesis